MVPEILRDIVVHVILIQWFELIAKYLMANLHEHPMTYVCTKHIEVRLRVTYPPSSKGKVMPCDMQSMTCYHMHE